MKFLGQRFVKFEHQQYRPTDKNERLTVSYSRVATGTRLQKAP